MDDFREPIEVERYPAFHFPASTTAINAQRLPPQERLREMELAYREEPRSRIELESLVLRASGLLLLIPLTAYLLPIALAALIPLIRLADLPPEFFWIAFGLGGAFLLLALLVAFVYLLSASTKAITSAVAVPLGIAAMIGAFFPHAVVLTTACSAFIALALLFLFAGAPAEFYRGWLLSDHRLTAEQRRNWLATLPQLPRPRLNIVAAAGTLLGLTVAMRFSPWAGFATLALTSLLVTGLWRGHRQAFHSARKLLTPYLTYNGGISGAPGVWIAPRTLLSRQLILLSPAALLAVALALATLGANHAQTPLRALSLIPPALLIYAALLVALFRNTLSCADDFRRQLDAELRQQPTPNEWETLTGRLRSSKHCAKDPLTKDPHANDIREGNHFFAGFEPYQNFPVLLDSRLLAEHCYIVGRSGSGKTSLGMMQLLIQLCRGHQTPKGTSEPVPIVILDLKGDEALFHTVRAEAKARGQQFLFFTPEPSTPECPLASCWFNPFQGFQSTSRTVSQLSQLILDALNLNHGSGYGRGYYSQRSRMLLTQALEEPNKPHSFDDLYKTVRRLAKADRKAGSEAFELIATIEALTHYEQLVTSKDQETSSPDQVIHIPTVIDKAQVAYFWLPSALESMSVATIGKLILFNLQTAAIDRKRAGKTSQVYLFIDEFQKLAGENLRGILQQARSHGIAAILANQSLRDLRHPDFDLGPAVQTNTRVKMFFSLSDPEEIRALSYLSGEELHAVAGEERLTIRPRLAPDDLIRFSDHPQQFILLVAQGSGYTQFGGLPVPVQTWWPMSKKEYDDRSHAPWPKLNGNRPIPVTPRKGAKKIETEVKRKAPKLDEFIEGIFDG